MNTNNHDTTCPGFREKSMAKEMGGARGERVPAGVAFGDSGGA